MTVFECGPIDYSTDKGDRVLNNIHLKLSSPCLAVISGPSGCGKTTLLRAVAGLNRAQVKTRKIDGQVFPPGTLPLWRSRVTLMLQDAPCIQGTVLQNLSFPYGFKAAQPRIFQEERATKLLQAVNLGHITMDTNTSTLSGGERHRLALVRGLLWAPPVLMADEPLSGLEPELADSCFELLMDYSRKADAVVICVLHEEKFSEKADKRFKIEHGTLHIPDTV